MALIRIFSFYWTLIIKNLMSLIFSVHTLKWQNLVCLFFLDSFFVNIYHISFQRTFCVKLREQACMSGNGKFWSVLSGSAIHALWLFTKTLVYLNSSLNPFLYCWKITEVRKAVKDTARAFCCCSWFEVACTYLEKLPCP